MNIASYRWNYAYYYIYRLTAEIHLYSLHILTLY